MTEESYTIAQVAKFTGLHAKSVRRLIKQGKLRAEMTEGKFGPEYQITKTALLECEPVKVSLSRGGGKGEGEGQGRATPSLEGGAGIATGRGELADPNPQNPDFGPESIKLLLRFQELAEELSEHKAKALLLEAAESEREDLRGQVQKQEADLQDREAALHAKELELATLRGLSWRKFRKWRKAQA